MTRATKPLERMYILRLAVLLCSVCTAKYIPSKAAASWPLYKDPAPWPPQAGQPLPKYFSEPKTDHPYASLARNVSQHHCEFLVASDIKWIVFLGDSVARATGVAMMEHLAGDDTHFCDPVDAPKEVQLLCCVLCCPMSLPLAVRVAPSAHHCHHWYPFMLDSWDQKVPERQKIQRVSKRNLPVRV